MALCLAFIKQKIIQRIFIQAYLRDTWKFLLCLLEWIQMNSSCSACLPTVQCDVLCRMFLLFGSLWTDLENRSCSPGQKYLIQFNSILYIFPGTISFIWYLNVYPNERNSEKYYFCMKLWIWFPSRLFLSVLMIKRDGSDNCDMERFSWVASQQIYTFLFTNQ